jgi:O-acetyl-ADP-ribose deacetylase (regulator of RNase III)/NAD-dependent SIR2 family protein deacetylase
MAQIMEAQGHVEPVGHAKVTPGFNLPAKYIIHTVGPCLERERGGGAVAPPSEEEKSELASCYRACLDAVEGLPLDSDGRLSIAFCCISTGLFAFPKDIAAEIAVHTVIKWCENNPDTPVTDIVFDVFTEEDLEQYAHTFDVIETPTPTSDALIDNIPEHIEHLTPEPPQSLTRAKQWLQEADYLIISAGAGLSAADGLDYTSQSLFSQHYPGLLDHGLRCLYDTIGFSAWPSAAVKWGYFFTHANLIRNWPKSALYASLRSLAAKFEEKDGFFVRTSNADGLFAANKFPETRIATPQGQYRYLQCPAKCRPDSVFPFADFLDKGLPFVDSRTQTLTDVSLIPHCMYCGKELTLCVRGGSYFNEALFEKQEEAWYNFIDEIENSEYGKTAVILELGVGLNTAGVLRWPNESLAEDGNGKFKLVRVGLGPSASLPFELVEGGSAVVIDGDISPAVKLLTR